MKAARKAPGARLHASFTPAPVVASHQRGILKAQEQESGIPVKELKTMKLNRRRMMTGLVATGVTARGPAGMRS